jgi:hypothetical protein
MSLNSTDKGKVPIDIASAVEYQKMKCEEKPESERAKCYEPKLKEIAEAQEKKAIIKAASGGSVILIFIIIVIVLLWFFLGRKKKKSAAAAIQISSKEITKLTA